MQKLSLEGSPRTRQLVIWAALGLEAGRLAAAALTPAIAAVATPRKSPLL